VRPDVSVVIPTYNHVGFLPSALQSVCGQTFPAQEVIVVDDGSTDDTGEVLRAWEGRIRIIRQPNRGVAAARNAGASMASADLLAFLDADDVWLPTKIEKQVAHLCRDPELGLVHCGVEEMDAEGGFLRRRLDGMDGWVSGEMLFFGRGVILGGGSAAVVPRAIFEAVGGFDERLSTSADWDLYYRIAERCRVGFVPEALVRYRVHGGNMHRNVRAMATDMLTAYAKVFSKPDPDLKRLRRSAYGGLHSMLAGSYFQAGDYRRFVRHALASVRARPEQIGYFAGYPVRALRRCFSASRVG
jgi:glycosyltransferase involved in cell wall biosynthesis